MRYTRWYALVCTAALLAGCGGGAAVPGSPGSQTNARKGTAVFRIRVPRKKHSGHGRAPGYVSAGTQSLLVALTGPSTVNQTIVVTPSSPNCSLTLEGTTCSFSVQVAPGSYTGTVTAYDNAVPASGKALSAALGLGLVITPGVANEVKLTLAGVPAKLAVTPATGASLTNPGGGIDLYGTFARSFYVQAFDADGYAIVGPGSPTFAIAQTGGSLPLTLGQPSTSAPNTFTVTPPAKYAAATASLTITATYAGQPSNGCAEPGAVCSQAVTFDMQELIAGVGNQFLGVYAIGQTDPIASITYLSVPSGVAFDGSGDIFVSECLRSCGSGTSVDTVLEFVPPYTGLPVNITNGVTGPLALAVNPAGDLFVANCYQCQVGGTDTVTEYAPPFSNSSAPVATITNGVSIPQALAFDAGGDLFVANCPSCVIGGTDTVTEYPAASYTGTPATIGSGTVGRPNSLALDATGDLFVSSPSTGVHGQAIEFLAPSFSSLTAVKISTGINNPAGVAFDPSGDLFVASYSNNRVIEYTSFSSPGTAAATIATASAPNAIVLDGAANLYAGLNNGVFDVFASPYTGGATALTNLNTIQYLAVLQ